MNPQTIPMTYIFQKQCSVCDGIMTANVSTELVDDMNRMQGINLKKEIDQMMGFSKNGFCPKCDKRLIMFKDSIRRIING